MADLKSDSSDTQGIESASPTTPIQVTGPEAVKFVRPDRPSTGFINVKYGGPQPGEPKPWFIKTDVGERPISEPDASNALTSTEESKTEKAKREDPFAQYRKSRPDAVVAIQGSKDSEKEGAENNAAYSTEDGEHVVRYKLSGELTEKPWLPSKPKQSKLRRIFSRGSSE